MYIPILPSLLKEWTWYILLSGNSLCFIWTVSFNNLCFLWNNPAAVTFSLLSTSLPYAPVWLSFISFFLILYLCPVCYLLTLSWNWAVLQKNGKAGNLKHYTHRNLRKDIVGKRNYPFGGRGLFLLGFKCLPLCLYIKLIPTNNQQTPYFLSETCCVALVAMCLHPLPCLRSSWGTPSLRCPIYFLHLRPLGAILYVLLMGTAYCSGNLSVFD